MIKTTPSAYDRIHTDAQRERERDRRSEKGGKSWEAGRVERERRERKASKVSNTLSVSTPIRKTAASPAAFRLIFPTRKGYWPSLIFGIWVTVKREDDNSALHSSRPLRRERERFFAWEWGFRIANGLNGWATQITSGGGSFIIGLRHIWIRFFEAQNLHLIKSWINRPCSPSMLKIWYCFFFF